MGIIKVNADSIAIGEVQPLLQPFQGQQNRDRKDGRIPQLRERPDRAILTRRMRQKVMTTVLESRATHRKVMTTVPEWRIPRMGMGMIIVRQPRQMVRKGTTIVLVLERPEVARVVIRIRTGMRRVKVVVVPLGMATVEEVQVEDEGEEVPRGVQEEGEVGMVEVVVGSVDEVDTRVGIVSTKWCRWRTNLRTGYNNSTMDDEGNPP